MITVVSFDCISNANSFGTALDEMGVQYICHMRGPRILFAVPDDSVACEMANIHGGEVAAKCY